MLKSCPSCSYIGNDGEHICPFCKADLALGKPRRASVLRSNATQTMTYFHTMKFKTLALLAVAAGAFSLTMTGCSVNPSGPAMAGGEHGGRGSPNQSDYYSKTD